MSDLVTLTVHPVERVPASELTTDQILHRMEIMLQRDRLVHGDYVGDDVVEELAEVGAVCGGHNACAVGHLWLAAGIEVEAGSNQWGTTVFSLPHTWPISERNDFLATRPPLQRAYEALNQAADEWAIAAGLYEESERFGNDSCGCYGGALEVLFEDFSVGADTLTEVTRRARELVA